jgi:hypothetical protein
MNIDLCVVGIIRANNVNMLIYWTSHAWACMHACVTCTVARHERAATAPENPKTLTLGGARANQILQIRILLSERR